MSQRFVFPVQAYKGEATQSGHCRVPPCAIAESLCTYPWFWSIEATPQSVNFCPAGCDDPPCQDGEDPPLDSSFGRYGSQNMPICSGDCDQDSDCAEGLQCFQRDGVQAVPGCSGRGVPNFDYCYNSSTAIPPPGESPCLCVFDIDRTLTGQQGAGSRCPLNKEIPDVWDSAYGGGRLSLSAAAP